jgi:thiol-disulfide isomerase/thioredoxin
MNTKIFTTTLVAMATLSFSAAYAQKPFKINGKIAKELNCSKCLVRVCDKNMDFDKASVDTINIKNGKFSYSVNLNESSNIFLYTITEDGHVSRKSYNIVSVPGETVNVLLMDKMYELDGKGTFYSGWAKIYKEVKPYKMAVYEMIDSLNNLSRITPEDQQEKVIQPLYERFLTKRDKYISSIQEYMEKNPGEEAAYIYAANEGVITFENILEKAGKYFENSNFSDYVKTNANKEKKQREEKEAREQNAKKMLLETAEGAMFKDFEAEYNGKVQKLSDYVGKGKYVLVDFWASWCGPCKREIPNLINVYNKYKGDKFEVLGVATWDKPADTERSIKELGIEYPQIINAQRAGSDAYGISGIPQIILFGPDGKIIKRDLRGEQIEAAVKNCLGK